MELSFSSLRIGKDYKRVNAGSMEALRSFSLMVLALELFWPWDPIISFTTIAIEMPFLFAVSIPSPRSSRPRSFSPFLDSWPTKRELTLEVL